MRTTLLISAFVFSGTFVLAQGVPAEFPPASYKGSQYVDSKGCVFIRAGIDGNVTWVPRVSRDRKAVCGFQPTNGGTAAASPAPVTPAAAPEQITIETAAVPAAAEPKPAPTKRTVRKPLPTVASTVVASPVAPAPMVRKGRDATASVSAGTRVLPRHVFEARQHTQATVVPKGYKLAWSDDRLNPRRAEGTLKGYAATKQVWTSTLPRTLRQTGPVQTGEVIVHNYAQTQTAPQGQVVQLKPTVSTKSEPAARVGEAINGRGYVQVGTFGKAANARATAQKLQRMGLPVRIGKLTRKGQAMQIVLAGPFANPSQTSRALTQVRRAGYSDAFTRK